MASPRARRIEVPGTASTETHNLETHYASAFSLPTRDAGSRSPEQWARAVFEGAPTPLRPVLRLGWTRVLGLCLGPKLSPDHILGWAIAEAGSDSITLAARSHLVAARNIVLVRGDDVVWVTRVQFNRGLARLVWTAAAPIHHLTIPWFLGRAERSLGRGTA